MAPALASLPETAPTLRALPPPSPGSRAQWHWLEQQTVAGASRSAAAGRALPAASGPGWAPAFGPRKKGALCLGQLWEPEDRFEGRWAPSPRRAPATRGQHVWAHKDKLLGKSHDIQVCFLICKMGPVIQRDVHTPGLILLHIRPYRKTLLLGPFYRGGRERQGNISEASRRL